MIDVGFCVSKGKWEGPGLLEAPGPSASFSALRLLLRAAPLSLSIDVLCKEDHHAEFAYHGW
jgi:hypothetical protein